MGVASIICLLFLSLLLHERRFYHVEIIFVCMGVGSATDKCLCLEEGGFYHLQIFFVYMRAGSITYRCVLSLWSWVLQCEGV